VPVPAVKSGAFQRVGSRWRGPKISDGNECPRANESRQADGEQNPQELNLFNVQVEALPALFVSQTGALANTTT
jgi:hypothetical protein